MVAALALIVLLGVGAGAWADGERTAEELLQERAARERIIEQKRQAEARALLEKGRALVEARRYHEAQGQLEQALELDPALEEARELLEENRDRLGLRPAAELLLQGQVRRDEVARAALRARVESLAAEAGRERRAGRYDEAMEKLTMAGNLIRYGRFREQLSELQQEVTRQAEAVERERERSQARLEDERRREALRLAARRKAEARAQLRATERELLAQGRRLYERGNYAEAARLAQVVANVDPDSTEAYVLLGQAKRRASRERFLALSEERGQDLRTQWEETVEASRPSRKAELETIEYPDDWKELTRRRQEVAVTSFGPPKEVWRTRLEEQLRRPVTFEFTEAPLSQVVEFLRTVSGTNIVLDRRGIQAGGGDPDMPISLKIKEVSLGDALDWLMDLSGLAYVLRKGAVLISDPSQIPKETYLVTYDVRDLLSPVPDFAGPTFDLEDAGDEAGGFEFEDEEDEEDVTQFISMQMSGEELVQFIIQALGLEGEMY
jgi:tetratricopeptide (TPR) repeat protein